MQTPHPGGCARRPRRFVLSPLRTIPNLGLQDEGRFPPPPRVPPPNPQPLPPSLPAALPGSFPGAEPPAGPGGRRPHTTGPGDAARAPAVARGGARATGRAAQDGLPPQPQRLFILKFLFFFFFFFSVSFRFGIYLS